MKQAKQKRTAKILAAAFSAVLTIAMIFAMLPATALTVFADTGVTYLDAGGTEQSVTNYTEINSDTSSLGDGWYVVKGNVEIDHTIRIIGNAHLILCDDATLTVNGGFNYCFFASSGKSFTIYAQSTGDHMGKLEAVSDEEMFCINVSDSALTINGGNVKAQGMYGLQARGATATINGGNISFIGDRIGIDIEGTAACFTINGGTVVATGKVGGIDATKGSILLNGGSLVATAETSSAITGTVKNAMAGTAWTNAEGTEGKADIAVNTAGQSLSNGYRKVQFPAQAEEAAYYLWGDITNWNPDDRSIPFSATETEGVYSVANVNFSAGDEFKVLAVLGTSVSVYPDGMDNNYTVGKSGTYDVYFRPAGDGAKADGWHEGYIKVEAAKYTITVEQPDEGGTIRADVAKADAGATVTLTASPDGGMALYEWTVTDAGNDPVTVAGVGTLGGTFTMPESNVKVTATFKETEHITESLTGVAINGEAIGDRDFVLLSSYGGVSISTLYDTVPTVTFVKETDVYFAGETEPRVITTNVDVVATEGEDNWSAQATIGEFTYAINIAKPKTVDLSTLTANYEAKDGEILTGTLGGKIRLSIAGGATVTLKNVTINSTMHPGLTCGNATIILKGKNTVKSSWEDCPGILVSDYSRLTISGDGSLDASGGVNAAGIGGRYNTDCGTIAIVSGTITARGGDGGAGIGSGNYAACSGIEISGGTVKAYGGEEGGAGIGTGSYSSNCAYIKISGGRIYAQGTSFEEEWGSAGIGTGVSWSVYGNSTCEEITITGGNIEAVGGPGAAAIGAGSGYKFYDVDAEEEYVSTSECNKILITNGVGKLKATKGNGSPQTIGGGKISVCYWGVTVLGGGAVTESPYNYLAPGPAGVIVLIDEIPNPVVVNNACKKAIEAARAAYDKLENDDQKALVTNYTVLTAAEAVFAIEDANKKLDAIPDSVEQITLADKDKITAARTAYDALGEKKDQIDPAKVTKLEAAEQKYAALKEADDIAKAQSVTDMINGLPGEITLNDKEKIDAARAAYEALDDNDQKPRVTPETLAKLEAAEAAYKTLDDAAKAQAVVDQIDAIGEVEFTTDSKTRIDAARTAYAALDENDQKPLVTNLGVLEAAEARYKELGDAAAANAVKDLIDAIGEVELTLNSKALIDTARTAYEALDEENQKPLVTNLGVLEAAEAKYEELVAIDRVENLIDEIGTVEYTDESALKIETAKKAFGELTEEQQAQVANAGDLTAAQAAFKALDDAAKAKFVSDLIAAIGTVEYTAESKAKIDEAEDALARLTDEQKPLVENADDLTAAKNTYAALKADREAAEAVQAQIAAIGTVEYTAESKAKIDAAKAAYEALTPAQKELVTNYSVLTVAEQTYAEKETEATAKKGLPGGVIALIVILSVLVVGCGAFAIVWFVVKKNSWAAFVELVKACCGKVAAFFRNLFKKK